MRNAKPGTKLVKLNDDDGLFLLLNPTGSKWWRIKYRIEGKEKLLSLGVDPSEHRKPVKASNVVNAANAFEVVGRESA